MVGTPILPGGSIGQTPNAGGIGAGAPPPGVQMIITNLQNLVQAVNALTQALTTQFAGTNVYLVSTLPTVAQPARAFVSDSTVAASTHFGAAVAGGGTNYVPVYFDNTSWKIG